MASEGRPPEDLQEAVAATLRRLRGEVGATGPRPAQRIEPQLSMPTSAPGPASGPVDEPPSPAPSIQEPPIQVQGPAPARRLEPDLLSAVSQTDIPPIPSSQGQSPTAYEPVEEMTAEEYVAPRRHWLRYVAALVVLIVFAALGWWGYRHFAGRAGSGQVPVVAADQTPEKVPPADQPATQTQSQQETVYNQISPGSTAQQPEVLLPQPETPSAPPAPAASAPTTSTTTSGNTTPGTSSTGTTSGTTVPAVPAPPPATGSTATGNSTGTLTETLLPAESTNSTAAPATGQTTTGQTTTGQTTTGQTTTGQTTTGQTTTGQTTTGQTTTGQTTTGQTTTGQTTTGQTTTGQTTGQATGTQTATTAAPGAPAATDTQGATPADQGATGTTPAAPAPANDAPTAAGNYRVQLAALKTEADAKTVWKRLAAKYPDILGPLGLHLEKVDLGAKGIYYRVQAGPFTDKTAARDICTKLKPKGQPCLVKP